MPTYEYACTSCGERTEARQGFDDPPLKECPICGGKLRKLYSPVGIVFKGSGFYSTDDRKKPSKPEAKTTDKKADKPSGDGAAKKEASPTPSGEKKK
jgi:putative FmdB family regulatory protein